MDISPQQLTIYLYSAHRAVIFAIAQLSCYKKRWSKIAVSNITNNTCVLTWRQPLPRATDRGVMRLGSQYHLCGSESVAYSSATASLRVCWWHFEHQL